MQLDRFDRQILNLVQRDCTATAEHMAQHVPLSSSAIQRRLKRLREHGIIVAETAMVDPKKVGRPTFFIVSVNVEREHPDLLASLRSWLVAHDEIQQVFWVTGSADFILVVTAQDTDAFDQLMSRLTSENPNVRKFTTNVALSVVKRGSMIPISLEGGDR